MAAGSGSAHVRATQALPLLSVPPPPLSVSPGCGGCRRPLTLLHVPAPLCVQGVEAAGLQHEASAAAARAEADHRRASEHRTAEECGMLRRALDQALVQMQVEEWAMGEGGTGSGWCDVLDFV